MLDDLHPKWVHARMVLAKPCDLGWPSGAGVLNSHLVRAWYWAQVWEVGKTRTVELTWGDP